MKFLEGFSRLGCDSPKTSSELQDSTMLCAISLNSAEHGYGCPAPRPHCLRNGQGVAKQEPQKPAFLTLRTTALRMRSPKPTRSSPESCYQVSRFTASVRSKRKSEYGVKGEGVSGSGDQVSRFVIVSFSESTPEDHQEPRRKATIPVEAACAALPSKAWARQTT